MIKLRDILLVVGILWTGEIFSQQPGIAGGTGVITGLVTDSLAKAPVEYAAVSLLKTSDSTIAGGIVTDEKGQFKIENIPAGSYFLRVKFIGYLEKTISGINISPAKTEWNVGTVFIAPAEQNLNEVEIVKHTEVMESSLDKKIINVEKDLTSTGGTALDLMKNVPSVQVDVDGNVSLRGNSNVRILIDGRISTLDPATMLQQIPASMVKQIEVITNPSAKYDPDGVSGIINIITKKERKPGYNGILTAGLGTGSKKPGGGMENFTFNKGNVSAVMNYQVGKINFFGSYDGRYGARWNKGITYTEIQQGDTTVILDQNNARMRPTWNHNGKFGFDLNITPSDMWTLGGNVRNENATSHEVFDYNSSYKGGDFIYHYARPTDQVFHENNYEGFSTFKHSFKQQGHQLVFDGFYSTTENRKDNQVYEDYYNASGDAYALDSVHDHIVETNARKLVTAQVDYVNPTQKFGRFETGLKYVHRDNTQDIVTTTNKNAAYDYTDSNRTNKFNYKEHLFSGYLIYGNAIKKFQYQAGIRFEQALTASEQYTLGIKYIRNFYNFFPSAHLKYSLKNDAEIGMSFSRRINRPGNNQLNPYPDYSDRLNLRVGNPYLRPEYIGSYEISYGKFTRQLTYTVTAFYRHTTNNFYRLRTLDAATGVSTVTFDNISQSHSVGLEATYNQSLTKWMRLNGNASGFYYLLEADSKYQTPETHNFSWTGRLSFNFTASKNFDAQVTVNYRGPMVAPQGTMRPMGNVDIGCKYDFWNKKASLSFKFGDIFNTQRFNMQASYYNFYSHFKHKWESRVANLTFTYKINQGTERKDKPRVEQGGDSGL